MHPLGRLGPLDRESTRQPVQRRFGGGLVQRRPSTKEIRRVKKTEHNAGIGDRHLGAAIAIAGRPRHRPGALGSDTQNAAAIDAGDRATARSNTGDVQRLQRDPLSSNASGGR